MRTSLNEIRQIEDYLLWKSPENELLFEAKKLLDPEWEEKVFWQQQVMFTGAGLRPGKAKSGNSGCLPTTF